MLKSILDAVGNTPLVLLKDGDEDGAAVAVKIESRNPAGSVKDRPALNMIDQAEKDGLLKPGDTIIEPTSGNMGVALAMVAAARGYKAIFVMPKSMSEERKLLMKAYGAELILIEEGGMKAAVEKAEELSEEKGYFYPSQFSNPANPAAHRKTAEEILKDIEGYDLAAFVAGVGTAGTLVGTGRVLKEKFKDVKLIAVEPATSKVLEGEEPGGHAIQGIGANFIPDNYDPSVVDEILSVTDDDAKDTARRVAKGHGLLAGVSSGANIWAAFEVAKEFPKESLVVTLAPDTGERYLSTGLFS